MNNNGQRNKLLVAIIAILLIANIALLAFLFWPKKRSHDKKNRDVVTYSLEKKVGFNEQQMSQYEQLREVHKQKMKPLFEELRSAKENFYQLLQIPQPDSVISKASIEIGNRQEAVDLQIFRHFREIRSLCTAEQQPEFDSVVKRIVHKYSVPYYKNKSQDKDTTAK